MLLVPFKVKPMTFGLDRDHLPRINTGQACIRCFENVTRPSCSSQKPFIVNVLQPPAILKQHSLLAAFAPDFYYSFISSKTYMHKYSDVKNEVVKGKRVNEGVQKAINQECSRLEDVRDYETVVRYQWSRVEKIFTKLHAHINRFVINITAWVLLKLLRRLFRTVQVREYQMLQLQEASQKNLPIVFLPNHQSHLDYILLTFAVWQWDIRVPHVAAGENLDIPFFSYFLRCLGAFFIKRRLDNETTGGQKDYVYRALLHSYLTQLLKNCEYIEFYVEGGRSRTGKTIIPKSGLLSVIVENFLNGTIPDCLLVPVSISYEKVIDNAFVLELNGERKKPETFWGTVKAIWRALRSNYGSVRIEIAEPMSLKHLLKNLQKPSVWSCAKFESVSPSLLDTVSPVNSSVASWPSTNSFNYSESMSSFTEDIRLIIKAACDHIVCDFTQNAVPMCTNLLAFLLMNKYPKGGRLSDIVEDLHWLTSQVINRGRDVGFNGHPEDVLHYAINLLGSELVIVEMMDNDSGVDVYSSKEELHYYTVKPNLGIPHVLRLAFYKNSVVSIFLLESVITNAILTLQPEILNSTSEFVLNENDIYNRCYALCDLLRFEFIFSHPCLPLQTALAKAMDRLIEAEIIKPNFTMIEAREVANDASWDTGDASTDNISVEGNRLKRFYVSDITITRNQPNDFYVPEEFNSGEENHDTIEEEKFLSVPGRLIRIKLSSDLNFGLFTFLANVLKPFLHSYTFTIDCLKDLIDKNWEENNFVLYLLNKSKEIVETSKGTISGEFVNMEYFRNAIKWMKSKQLIKSIKKNEREFIELDEAYKSDQIRWQEFQIFVESLCAVVSLK